MRGRERGRTHVTDLTASQVASRLILVQFEKHLDQGEDGNIKCLKFRPMPTQTHYFNQVRRIRGRETTNEVNGTCLELF